MSIAKKGDKRFFFPFKRLPNLLRNHQNSIQMKKNFILLLVVGLFTISCNNNKGKFPADNKSKEADDYRNGQKGDEENATNNSNTGSWASDDIRKFNAECRKSLEAENVTEDVMSKVCPCLLEKFQAKYSNVDEMDKKSSEAEGEAAAKECMAGITPNANNEGNITDNDGSTWSVNDENKFMKDCEGTATQSVGAARANVYCDCMLQKVKKLFSNYIEADRGLLKLPEGQVNKMASDCNGQ
jgi:hypothetical protein